LSFMDEWTELKFSVELLHGGPLRLTDLYFA
jgi:hypothetical protein